MTTLYAVVADGETKLTTYFENVATDEAARLMLRGHAVRVQQTEGVEEDAKAEAVRRLTEMVAEVEERDAVAV